MVKVMGRLLPGGPDDAAGDAVGHTNTERSRGFPIRTRDALGEKYLDVKIKADILSHRKGRCAMSDRVDRFLAEWNEQDLELPQLRPEVGFVYRIAGASKLLGQRLDATCRRFGLTRSQYEALAVLRRKHPRPLCAQDIMDASLLTSGSVTAMINQLLKAGHVERDLNPDDRRRIQVRLTPAGTRLIEAAVQERAADNARLARLLSRADREHMNGLMRRFLEQLSAMNEEDGS
ncbi:MAG: MarR family transcriptional regulator [Candidatus Krumholzibacteriia bacterium]